MPATKIIVLQANSFLGNIKVHFKSNPMPYPEYFYLSMSAFLVSLTAPNKQLSKVGSKLFINYVYVYYFFMIECDFVLF